MEWIQSYKRARHALVGGKEPVTLPGGRNVFEGRTLCSRTVVGRSGAGLPSSITCGSCLRSLRADGWEV